MQGLDAAAQTRITLDKIEKSLAQAGAGMSDIVRLTIFITDLADGSAVSVEIAKAMPRPITSTLIGIVGLVQPGLLVEIETTAVVADSA